MKFYDCGKFLLFVIFIFVFKFLISCFEKQLLDVFAHTIDIGHIGQKPSETNSEIPTSAKVQSNNCAVFIYFFTFSFFFFVGNTTIFAYKTVKAWLD